VSNYRQLGDVHTYYEEDGAGEPLVLLHPGLADSRAFEEYLPELAQHFHVFRPDRRGQIGWRQRYGLRQASRRSPYLVLLAAVVVVRLAAAGLGQPAGDHVAHRQ
jgi:pimeloyl-ACP methyl ester carboxylesterase